MSSTLGHEINNPLTVAMGMTHFLKKEFCADRLNELDTALVRIQQLVEEIRSLEADDIQYSDLAATTNVKLKNNGM